MAIEIEKIDAIIKIHGMLIPEFVKYGKLYLNTTENISGIMSNIDLHDKSVLSVAGSGDQALNAFLNGAKSVTLFDINPLTFALSELKLASPNNISFEEFCEFFIPGCGELLNYPTFLKLSNHINEDAAIYFDHLYSKYTSHEVFTKTFRSFKTDLSRLSKMNDYLNEDSYKMLATILEDKKVWYIESNLLALPTKLNEMYDAILLSNISDSIDNLWNINTLKCYKRFIHILSQSLNKEGIIQCGYVYSSYKNQIKRPIFANQNERQKIFLYPEFEEWKIESFVRDSDLDDTVIVYKKKRKKAS